MLQNFIPTLANFDRKNEGIDNKSQSRDKILCILLAFVSLSSYDGN